MKYYKVVTIDYVGYLIYNFDMKIRIFLNKLAYLLKQNRNEILLSISISAILICFFIFAVIPYGGYLDIGDISYSATTFDKIKYLLFIIPFIIWYFFIIIKTIKKIKFARILIYPIILISLWLCIFMCVTVLGYENILLYFFTSIFLFPICFVITEIYAIIKDIKTFKNTTIPDDYDKD